MFDKEEFDRWMTQASDTLNYASPFEFYDDITALEALDCAEKLCDFCATNRKKYE